jgi:phosphoribosyl-ATP pyrophosphohydrolase
MSNAIDRLYRQVLEARGGDPATSRTAKLWRDGNPKLAKKVAEEAIEVSLEAVEGNRPAMVRESADLIYNLVMLWAGMGVSPDEIWQEMARREELLGIAEKLPKTFLGKQHRRLEPPLAASPPPAKAGAERI